MAYTLIFYAVAGSALVVSLITDAGKTLSALKKAWKAFTGILPEFLMIIVATGLILAYLTPELVASVVGRESGAGGVLLASIAGSVTLMRNSLARLFSLAVAGILGVVLGGTG